MYSIIPPSYPCFSSQFWAKNPQSFPQALRITFWAWFSQGRALAANREPGQSWSFDRGKWWENGLEIQMFLGNVGSSWGRCAENAGSQWNAVFVFVVMGDAIHLAPLIQSNWQETCWNPPFWWWSAPFGWIKRTSVECSLILCRRLTLFCWFLVLNHHFGFWNPGVCW